MVYSKPPPDKLAFDYDPTKSGIKVDTPLYMLFMEKGKLLIDQMIMRRRKYEAESQLENLENIQMLMDMQLVIWS